MAGSDPDPAGNGARDPGADYRPARDGVHLWPERITVSAAERLKTLGQPVRLRLVQIIANHPSTPTELGDVLGLTQQNVSKHLVMLDRAGVLSRRRDGNRVIYALDDPNAIAILDLTVESVSKHLRDLANLAVASSSERVPTPGNDRPDARWSTGEPSNGSRVEGSA